MVCKYGLSGEPNPFGVDVPMLLKSSMNEILASAVKILEHFCITIEIIWINQMERKISRRLSICSISLIRHSINFKWCTKGIFILSKSFIFRVYTENRSSFLVSGILSTNPSKLRVNFLVLINLRRKFFELNWNIELNFSFLSENSYISTFWKFGLN